jgi:hypothetical protein
MIRGSVGLAVRVSATAAAFVLTGASVLLAAPADGASCAGVTTVVDFGALGGGVQERCVDDGADRPAWEVFDEAGFPLTPVQQFPDAVCRVSGKPVDNPCVRMPPANAYWGLFSSTGKGWVYATQGPNSLTVPAGGTLGFAWQNTAAQRAPGAAPASPSPIATKQPTKHPTRKAAGPAAGATGTPSATASAAPSASATATGSATASATPSTSPPSASPSMSGAATVSEPEVSATAADAGSAESGGLAWWVPVVVLLALAGGAGGAWWTRRRASGG